MIRDGHPVSFIMELTELSEVEIEKIISNS
jgi:hypothetical protein